MYGAQFGSTGYSLNVSGLATGDWVIAVYGWVEATQSFSAVNYGHRQRAARRADA